MSDPALGSCHADGPESQPPAKKRRGRPRKTAAVPADAGPARGRPGINPPASFVAFSTLPAAAALPQQPTTDLSWPQRMQPATDTQSQSAHAAAQLLDALGSIPAAAAGLPVPFILPSSPSARQHASSELLTEQAAPHQPPAVDPAAHAPALATNGHQLGARLEGTAASPYRPPQVKADPDVQQPTSPLSAQFVAQQASAWGPYFRLVPPSPPASKSSPVVLQPDARERARPGRGKRKPHQAGIELSAKAALKRTRKPATHPAALPPLAAASPAADGSQPQGSQPQRKRRKTAKKGADKADGAPPADDAPYTKLVIRVRAQLQRMRQEQALLDAYANDGWRGAKREAVRPKQELERAARQLDSCRASIQDCVRQCDESQGDRAIPDDLFDEHGELDESDIFCARCTDFETNDEANDIVLCDGPCNRAYHFLCATPPIKAQDLKEDEPWLCPACDAKADIVNLLNDHLSLDLDVEDPWQKFDLGQAGVGSEAATPDDEAGQAVKQATTLLNGHDLPSDTDDSSFKSDDSTSGDEELLDAPGSTGKEEQPNTGGNSSSGSGSDSSDSSSGDSSSSSSSASDSSGEEDSAESSPQAMPHVPASLDASREQPPAASEQPRAAPAAARLKNGRADRELGPEQEEDDAAALPAGSKRQRQEVDYAQLAAEMFGESRDVQPGEVTEDDDWSPRAAGVQVPPEDG